jgi:hypothetical protein
MLPRTFQEKVVRLYLKKDIQDYDDKNLTLGYLKQAFNQWVEDQNEKNGPIFSRPL